MALVNMMYKDKWEPVMRAESMEEKITALAELAEKQAEEGREYRGDGSVTNLRDLPPEAHHDGCPNRPPGASRVVPGRIL
jgi:hypothetical protein